MPPTPLSSQKQLLVESLRQKLDSSPTLPGQQARISSGCAALDRILPAGGFQRGQLVEWLEDGPGNGATTLALVVARQAAGEQGIITIMDQHQQFFPPAAAALGINLDHLLVIQPASPRDHFWALDQVTRCPAIAAVWASLEHLDSRDHRRLQLAAEQSNCLGLFTRPTRVRGQPSWSQIQLCVHTLPSDGRRRWNIEVTRARGSYTGQAVTVEIDEIAGTLHESTHEHPTDSLHPDSQLAYPTPAGYPT